MQHVSFGLRCPTNVHDLPNSTSPSSRQSLKGHDMNSFTGDVLYTVTEADHSLQLHLEGLLYLKLKLSAPDKLSPYTVSNLKTPLIQRIIYKCAWDNLDNVKEKYKYRKLSH